MSVVTNVILAFFPGESEDARLAEVNSYFDPEHTNVFKELENYAGSKYLERCTYVGAFNYLGVIPFIEHVRKANWRHPEWVQLFICEQDEEIYRERFHEKI